MRPLPADQRADKADQRFKRPFWVRERRVLANPWGRCPDGGVVDAEGYLAVTGRFKDIIIRKGEKVSAREIEELLARPPAVSAVAVVAIPDRETGERAYACVIPRHAATLSLAGLTSPLRAAGLATRKLPERLVLMADFPRTPSGKVHKAALRTQIA